MALVSANCREEGFLNMSSRDSAVTVTAAEERVHPALGKLARACIALARLKLAARKSSAPPTTPSAESWQEAAQ